MLVTGQRRLLLVVSACVFVEGFITLAMHKEEREGCKPFEILNLLLGVFTRDSNEYMYM